MQVFPILSFDYLRPSRVGPHFCVSSLPKSKVLFSNSKITLVIFNGFLIIIRSDFFTVHKTSIYICMDKSTYLDIDNKYLYCFRDLRFMEIFWILNATHPAYSDLLQVSSHEKKATDHFNTFFSTWSVPFEVETELRNWLPNLSRYKQGFQTEQPCCTTESIAYIPVINKKDQRSLLFEKLLDFSGIFD